MNRINSRKPSKAIKPSKETGQIRIIAGKHRGRKLPVLMADGLRPTTDRVKETVFNWLMPYLYQSRCLDCFAGSGSLGFEALSRGAEEVALIELNKDAAKQLKQNATTLKADNIAVYHQDILSYLQQTSTSFDLVFVDPPFRKGLVKPTLEQLEKGWLADDAVVYVEMEAETSAPALGDNWQLLKEKIAGQVAYRLYQYSR
ncbi:16S rRNA (guanine(966)-N(2))-methyltransferase RsmD [Endozoicomonas sp. G2_1]|uniref:16S rRNA (guanine(966)-N(2))-methyltransferase RsmD n=1 Tax=Endozoicomonas sp. G2_1 TaxID=2821091 RepID=UPI001AD9ACA3|nr:16S rRNA (guanine(966)-N(2))-methyltransferase RsmD [Endozoicomonas sp. G2_1]MBO9491328.1 16S rRNA (guanine(966)-N(2))-methyltransferase RsmD [Endozoicomonas sp. G2_1]